MTPRVIAGALAVAASSACTSSSPAGPTFEIDVAPLTLSGVADACYTLSVRNEANELVWTRANVCASQFGDGKSAITWVGPCDASDGPDADSVATNTVTLTIDGLYREDPEGGAPLPLTDWVDPCAAPYAPNGCQLATTCSPNGDTPVRFDLTSLCVSRTTWRWKRMRRDRIGRACSGLRRSLRAILWRPSGSGSGATQSRPAVST